VQRVNPGAHLRIRDVPESERPRERMMREGAERLSNAELVAILLRTGTSSESALRLAERVLTQTGGLRELADVTLNELMNIRGIGPAKAVQLFAGIELGRRISRTLPPERKAVRSPKDAADWVMEEMRHLKQEHFVCLFLNTKNHVLEKERIFVGTLNSSVVHPREVFRQAIRRSAAGVICFHNHPSGDPSPSVEDIQVTERLFRAGRIVGIELIDHIIIGDGVFYSMRENGYLPGEPRE
jgi:DNA repair protein RadC